MQPITSNCKYLFGKEANEIFANSIKNEVIENYLEMLMKVHHYFLEKKEAFFLLVPRAGNDQCHLYCLKALQIQKAYKIKSYLEKSEKSEENRYMHLCMLLSFAMTLNKENFAKAIQKALDELNLGKDSLSNNKRKNQFKTFLLDNDQRLEKAARQALLNLFKTDLQQTLKAKENELVYQELLSLSDEYLDKEPSRTIQSKSMVYTYPGFASLVHFFEQASKEEIPFVIKVKILTKEGAGGVVVIPSNTEIKDEEPTLVIEAFAKDESSQIPGTKLDFTISNSKEEAKKCPSYFMRYENLPLSKLRHHEKEDCFYCKRTSFDLMPYKEMIQKTIESPKQLFHALGVDSLQPEFRHFFQKHEKYPVLSQLFSEAEKFSKPIFSGCHMHLDDGKHAKSEEFQFDMTSEQLLKDRGIL